MRFRPAVLPSAFAFLLLCGAAFAGDTTFSRTEAVPKSSSSSDAPDPGPSSHSDDRAADDDAEEGYVKVSFGSDGGGGGGSGFMAACLDIHPQISSFQQLAGLLIFWPFWMGVCGAADGLWISHAHLFTGTGEMEAWPDGRWRFGLGFGLGAAFMPGIAGGLPLELHLEATGALAEDWQLRLRSGAFANLMGSSVDYRRYVLVDGKRIGSQLDVMNGYTQSGFSHFADLIRPLGSHGLYLAGGAGGVLMKESIEYLRQTDYGLREEPREEERWQVLPALDAALGRYGGGGDRRFWRFEIRYQALMHSPLQASSFPGDNAYVTHSVTWEWAWF